MPQSVHSLSSYSTTISRPNWNQNRSWCADSPQKNGHAYKEQGVNETFSGCVSLSVANVSSGASFTQNTQIRVELQHHRRASLRQLRQGVGHGLPGWCVCPMRRYGTWLLLTGLFATAALVTGCGGEGRAAGTGTEGPLRVVGGEPERFGFAYWSLTPGDPTIVSAGAVRLCVTGADEEVNITRVYYRDSESLSVNAWATAPLVDTWSGPGPIEPSALTDLPNFADGSRVVRTPCVDGDAPPTESQTSFGWEATWLGPGLGVGEGLVIEYVGADGQPETLELDTGLTLCATEQECLDAEAEA